LTYPRVRVRTGKEQEGKGGRGRGRKQGAGGGVDRVDASNAAIKQIRKKMWFEKFYWFVSSRGLLVLGGRDARQNELLVKRYMRASDLYVHADVHGASSIIIRCLGVLCTGLGRIAWHMPHAACRVLRHVCSHVCSVACALTVRGSETGTMGGARWMTRRWRRQRSWRCCGAAAGAPSSRVQLRPSGCTRIKCPRWPRLESISRRAPSWSVAKRTSSPSTVLK
jgi:hypothetical protein